MMKSQLPTFKRPAVLVFNRTNGFRHDEAIPAADRVFSELAAENGWDVFVTDDAEVHEPDALDKFQLVVWNNVSGDVLTLKQRESLRRWLESGGGWLGIHASGGDLSYDWDWYVDDLYKLVSTAWPYRDLSHDQFLAVFQVALLQSILHFLGFFWG